MPSDSEKFIQSIRIEPVRAHNIESLQQLLDLVNGFLLISRWNFKDLEIQYEELSHTPTNQPRYYVYGSAHSETLRIKVTFEIEKDLSENVYYITMDRPDMRKFDYDKQEWLILPGKHVIAFKSVYDGMFRDCALDTIVTPY